MKNFLLLALVILPATSFADCTLTLEWAGGHTLEMSSKKEIKHLTKHFAQKGYTLVNGNSDYGISFGQVQGIRGPINEFGEEIHGAPIKSVIDLWANGKLIHSEREENYENVLNRALAMLPDNCL